MTEQAEEPNPRNSASLPLGSPWGIPAYAVVLLVASFGIFGGWVLLGLFLLPHYVLPGALAAACVTYFLFEILGQGLLAFGRLTFLNLLAVCGVLALVFGFLPWQRLLVNDVRGPFDLLLEDYALAAAFYAGVLYVLSGTWWLTILTGKVTGQRKVRTAAAVLLIVAPFVLLVVAQTSRLHDAVRSKDLARVKSALKPWKSVNGRDRRGETPLSLAMSEGDIPISKFLLERGASIHFTLHNGRQVNYLFDAVNYRGPKFVNLLLDHGASLADGEALNLAVRKADPAMVRLLLDRGAPVNAKVRGRTALMVAVTLSPTIASRMEIVRLLVQRGADLRAHTEDERSVLDLAIDAWPNYGTEMLQALVKYGAPWNERNPRGHTPLYTAVRARRIDAVSFLLNHGADANDGGHVCDEPTCVGPATALHQAADARFGRKAQNTPEIAATLIQAGARVNVRDPHGRTPLYFAVLSQNIAVARLLLEAGADPNLGPRGARPTDANKGDNIYLDFTGLLRKYGAKK